MKYRISVVIVNYNVKHFLDQCLASVNKACENIKAEVFVVDNNSFDGSVEMVLQKYPNVKVIANKDNKGFSYANNQAIKQSDSDYILLLNPDTIVEEETFTKTIAFMDNTPDCGGLTVKMIDGKGNFLPESKRGLPTPKVAFYKIFGFSSMFPKAKEFGRYHLGFLPDNETHSIDVLSGAYMMMRYETLQKVGLLDESFFMYGEDIDLSYRITQGGYKNYYFPETKIIHYKGESTKKSSINYVFVFYKAMIIFANKHFINKNTKIFSFLINIAIYLRAFVAILSRFALRAIVPFVDFSVVAVMLFAYISLSDFGLNIIGQLSYTLTFASIFTCINYLIGSYIKPIRFSHIPYSLVLLFVTMVSLLSFVKRIDFGFLNGLALMFLLAITGIMIMFVRSLIKSKNSENLMLDNPIVKNILIVGDKENSKIAFTIVNQNIDETPFAGFVNIDESKEFDSFFIGNISDLSSLIEKHNINEVIFCSKNLSYSEILENIELLKSGKLDFKILPSDREFIIGSNSIEVNGIPNILQKQSLNTDQNIRAKVIFDKGVSLVMLLFFPIILFFIKKPFETLKNMFAVLSGRKTWIGVNNVNFLFSESIYKVDEIFSPLNLKDQEKFRMDMSYISHYNPYFDFSALVNHLKKE